MNSNSGKESDPVLSQLARGSSLAFANAEDLFNEAKILSACRAYSRALFLHQISMEECGKAEMIGWQATSHLMGTTVDFGRMKSQLASHKAKNFTNAYMLLPCEKEQKARGESAWDRAHYAFKEQQAAFHQRSNDRKNASLYVDFVDGAFIAPIDRITKDMMRSIQKENQEFIELMRPKVEMLSSWVQAPDRISNLLKSFRERVAVLSEQYPDDLRDFMDAVLEEFIGKDGSE